MDVWDTQSEVKHLRSIVPPSKSITTMVALKDSWIAGLSQDLHIWDVDALRKANQTQPIHRLTKRIAYHAASQTMAVAEGNWLKLYRLNLKAIDFLAVP